MPQSGYSASLELLAPSICDSDRVPVTSQLFGDDLASSLRGLKELDKLNASLQPSSSTSRFPGKLRQAPFLGPNQGKGTRKNEILVITKMGPRTDDEKGKK
ncbi:hypothetical protein PoB_003545000 [Plakobranchus ocellatus]|uniref:Uncharacterized protein n=1 Tax=Plakobranchus ocellatus TaxID=259542 RepID=A0AAV4ANK7_9GAST|nr:hypothetical protein PoB_003545000 [Plakobranchus ocellatus]